MVTKTSIFSSVISGSPMITLEKLVGSDNYLSWSASVELWFMGQGYEDHLITQEADIPEAKGLYTNDIQRLYKVASAIVHISQQDLDLSTYIGQIASLKEEFLTVMPLTPDVGAQQIQLDKFFMVLTFIGLRPDLEPVRDQILSSSSVPSLDDVFARLLPLEEAAVVPKVEVNVLIAPIAINLATLAIVAISYMDDLLALPMWPSPLIFRCLSLRALPHLRLLLPLLPTLDRSTGKTIGIGRESQGLYHLTSDSSPAVCISTDAPLLIHNRLGHPSLSKFQKMVPHFSTLSSLPCESCQLGKHTRVSFPKRLNNRAQSHFELVHTDVWGPCRTASTLGFQYFVTFIDDYSRSPFTSFMSHHGILHQSSCAHTPQQNGVAERKNRHLVETTRTILLHSNVPFRFWGDAVLTACYLINRMPSSVLHDQIPHSLLFPDQPLYFLPPRVFGCTCFVHILTLGQDKLSSKAMKYLFLGYSRLQKGYRCYSLRLIDTLSPLMSPSLRTHHSFPPLLSLFLFLKSCPFPLSPHLMLCLLDHFRFIIVALVSLLLSLLLRQPADSFPIPSALPVPALPSPNDLPIAVRKGAPMKLFLIQAGCRQWWMKWLLCTLMTLGILLFLPSGKSTVGCRWVYAVKVGPDGQVDRLKTRLVAKGYTQVYGSDYGDTFSPVAKIASVRLLLSMAAMCSWPLYQLDIKNAFLHGDLAEEVYMEQPLGFVAQGESGLVCRLCCSLYGLKQSPRAWFSRFSNVVQEFGMLRSTADHSVFYHHNSLGPVPKTWRNSSISWGIEIAQSNSGVVLSQRKYALDILEETGMLDCKPVDTPMDPNVKLVPGQREPLGDPGKISTARSHWDAVIRILRYIKSTPGQGVLYENRGHTQVVGYTDVDWADSPTDRRSTSGAALHIASNPVFHERTKHIEVDCHFIREKIASGCVATSFVNSNDQLADIFTKSLRGPRIKYICNKLGAYDVYVPA
ncbi:Retrovirus-related Pol polyprotein from transposon RE1 [Vitis vinifera]|uniref:Retrovirus-related Pol polyprotein from transposon RE1 n=1 Tax=Vitis vinifera TaxID=29760 RepID=A0A438JBT6_VITVI|nr:Retrovirus-related Pol polyprotein from transposon RE1 [Vitis vinifera]